MRGNEAGDPAMADEVGDAISRAAGQLKRRVVPEGVVAGVVTKRWRRTLWAITSVLFVLGFAASTAVVHTERNAALDSAVEDAREEAQFVVATLATLEGMRLSDPIKGSSYDRFAAKIWRSVSSKGTIVGVTVWSPEARILFSLDESLVGKTRPEMRSPISQLSQASDPSRIVDDMVQTFMPITNGSGRTVAFVEVDQPLAAVEARMGSFWSTLRVQCGIGLAISLLLFGLTFFSRSFSRSLAQAPEDAVLEPEQEERQEAVEAEAVEAVEMNDAQPAEVPVEESIEDSADEPTEEPTDEPTEEPAPYWETQLQALGSDLARAMDKQAAPYYGDLAPAVEQKSAPEVDHAPAVEQQTDPEEDHAPAVEQETAPDGEVDPQELMRQRREAFKARAEKAQLRKKTSAELQEAASGTESAE